MYNIYFYRDKNGRQPVLEYLRELKKQNSKDARIKLNKLNDYIEALKNYGTRLGEPYVKHIDGDIWELRPLRDRVMFAAWNKDGFVLLHQFVKNTQKTPKREIEKAKRELADLIERSDGDE
ncbi:MAG: type II toxin-antitoxin system RelE/ParE family toxin [Firmicutes bacterium]|nr:type II toxin-antitoxin system RelE/ParE family toxin [Bacillota bacterium]